MNNTLLFYLITSSAFAIGNIVLSAVYFIKIKEIWRYVKLFYILANIFVLINVLSMLTGHTPGDETRIMGLLVLLASQFSGLMVSIAKVKVADNLAETIQNIKDEIKSL